MKSSRRSVTTSRKSVTTPNPSLSSQSPVSTAPTCPGTRVGPSNERTLTAKPRNAAVSLSSKPSTTSCSPSGHPPSPSDSHSRTSTRSAVSEQCQSAESKPVPSRPVWLSPSHQLPLPLKSNPSKCTTKPWNKPSPVTTLVSTSRTSPSRTSEEVTLLPTPRTTQPRNPNPSKPRSSSSTTLVKSKKVTPQSSIAILPTSPANSKKCWKRSIDDPVRRLKITHPRSNLEMLLSSTWSHLSQCASKLSQTMLLSVDSLSVIC